MSNRTPLPIALSDVCLHCTDLSALESGSPRASVKFALSQHQQNQFSSAHQILHSNPNEILSLLSSSLQLLYNYKDHYFAVAQSCWKISSQTFLDVQETEPLVEIHRVMPRVMFQAQAQ